MNGSKVQVLVAACQNQNVFCDHKNLTLYSKNTFIRIILQHKLMYEDLVYTGYWMGT